MASRTADRLALSIGVAFLPIGQTTTVQKFTNMADKSLYTAQKNGRNRVERSTPTAPRHPASLAAERLKVVYLAKLTE